MEGEMLVRSRKKSKRKRKRKREIGNAARSES